MNKVLAGARVIICIFLVLLGGIALRRPFSPQDPPDSPAGLFWELLGRYHLEISSEGTDSVVWSGEHAGKILRIHAFRNWSLEMAENYISDKMFVIRSLYREIQSPYPGALSNRIGCAEEFKPERIEHQPMDYYRLYATDRLTYGACSWDLISYQTILRYIYCEDDNTLYQIELFVPVDEYSSHYEESLKTLVCSSSAGQEEDVPPSVPSLQMSLLKDGEPRWLLGQNVAWLEESDSHDYEYYLRRLHDAGVELVRVVLVPWHLHEEWGSLGVYNEERLGEVIRAARSAGFSAGPMIWWRGSYIKKEDLYPIHSRAE